MLELYVCKQGAGVGLIGLGLIGRSTVCVVVAGMEERTEPEASCQEKGGGGRAQCTID